MKTVLTLRMMLTLKRILTLRRMLKLMRMLTLRMLTLKMIIIWFGDTVTVSHSTKCDTNSKVRALS